MASEEVRPIIVKRIKKVSGGAHGGAWKIAYADFVTAMMAFFLLMWLLGSTTKGTLQGIAEYFQTPLKVALNGGEGSGDSSSIVRGGGRDLTASEGQNKKSDAIKNKKNYSLKDAQATLAQAEAAHLKQLKEKIEAVFDANPSLKQYKKQLMLDMTTDGLRIQIMDDQNRPMFALAKADLQPYTKEILDEIGVALNEVPNKISISGHTDAAAYSSGVRGYSNWELSADRANATRRELVAAGMDENKVLRVIGLSSSALFDKENPNDPINRRISIIVLNKQAELAAAQDGGGIDVGKAAENQEPDKETLGAGAPAVTDAGSKDVVNK